MSLPKLEFHKVTCDKCSGAGTIILSENIKGVCDKCRQSGFYYECEWRENNYSDCIHIRVYVGMKGAFFNMVIVDLDGKEIVQVVPNNIIGSF